MTASRTERKAGPVTSKRKKSPGQVLESTMSADHLDEELEQFNSELVEEPGGKLAARLPESLTIAIDLPPAPERGLPEDEAAVRIDDVAVPANTLPGTLTGEIGLGELRVEEERRTPYRPTGSAYDALLGSRAFTSFPTTTGEFPRFSTGEVPHLTGEAPRFTGESPGLTGEYPTGTGSAPPGSGAAPPGCPAARPEQRAGSPAWTPSPLRAARASPGARACAACTATRP